MSNRIQCADLQIDEALHALLVNEIAPGTGIDPDHFWQGAADIWATLGPENQRLLAERDSLQAQIDQWHRDHQGEAFDAAAYETSSGRSLPAPRAAPLASPLTTSIRRLRRSPARSSWCRS
ncbi:MAG: hypothetical protein CM15mP89_1420 [Gammaproteobacteria bacterium]|nr:MAG: hypothetical protein CM15mP89_1420 [Gammaproteobacteria bacterium]